MGTHQEEIKNALQESAKEFKNATILQNKMIENILRIVNGQQKSNNTQEKNNALLIKQFEYLKEPNRHQEELKKANSWNKFLSISTLIVAIAAGIIVPIIIKLIWGC